MEDAARQGEELLRMVYLCPVPEGLSFAAHRQGWGILRMFLVRGAVSTSARVGCLCNRNTA